MLRLRCAAGQLRRLACCRSLLLFLCGLGLGVGATARPAAAAGLGWLPFGPFGGDARSFGVDAHDHTHLFLGTVDGWIYETHNGGQKWERLARLGQRDDLAVDHILVDPRRPQHLLAGTWVLGKRDGDLYESNDGGHVWTVNADLRGESIRSLTSDARDFSQLIAGTLQGVFRSTDGGEHWSRISPEGSSEIHEVQSVAVDPKDPKIVYAGTWHLPWKTTDGGAHWSNIKNGIIDDSDVFSIIVDPKTPQVVYASACSGIYKSEDAGGRFVKVQGIPSTARRTRVLKQDPQQLNVVFAGTTEGLFRTTDSGANWSRTTGSEVVVNDVYIDPTDSNRVLLATDHGGVVASDDGGNSFRPANEGFTARQVVAYAADRTNPAQLYIGVLNDKEWGGVFTSRNGGLTWTQQSTGLGGRDVFGLAQAEDGTIVAATSRGLFQLRDAMWQQAGEATSVVRRPISRTGRRPGKPTRASAGATARPAPEVKNRGEALEQGFYSLAVDSNQLYAVGEGKLMTSDTSGASWRFVPGVPEDSYRAVAVAKTVVLVASLTGLARSTDGGQSWSNVAKPTELSQIAAIAVDDEGDLWAGGREGLFVQRGGSGQWTTPPNLPIRDINSVYFDRRTRQVLVTANTSTTLVYGLQLPSFASKVWDAGWHMRLVRAVGDHLVGATLYDGVVIQPAMVASPFAERK